MNKTTPITKKIEQSKCIAISTETHAMLVTHIVNTDGKIGKFAERAIREKIEKEEKKMSS